MFHSIPNYVEVSFLPNRYSKKEALAELMAKLLAEGYIEETVDSEVFPNETVVRYSVVIFKADEDKRLTP